MRTILYIFGGRRENLEIAIPYYRDIIARYPDVEVHLWDLSQRDTTGENHRYLRTIPDGERFTVRREFYRTNISSSRAQNMVWHHYTEPRYRGCRFVKADDDVLFFDTTRFGEFVERAETRPNAVVSALTINNGASTPLIPDLWSMRQQLDIPLLDVHLSAAFAQRCHRWFFDHWQELIESPAKLLESDTWVSINCITYAWETGRRIARLLGSIPPAMIKDRPFPPRNRPNGRPIRQKVGDEGAVNLQPVYIDTGFTVAHLAFGPQVNPGRTDGPVLDAATQTELRDGYRRIAAAYLSSDAAVQA